MPRYRRANTAGGTYFFTVIAYRRQPILCDEAIRNALRTAIETVRAAHPFVIDAWVLLPDHLHCMWTLPDGDADFSGRWSLIKSGVSRMVGSQYRRVEWMSASKLKRREPGRVGTLLCPRGCEYGGCNVADVRNETRGQTIKPFVHPTKFFVFARV